MKSLSKSELILNDDGSIYHLNLQPGDIADTIITVGDPDRVGNITQHFDTIEISKQKREFKTQTGTYKGKRITVISTGIGTDNIDIVFNELDALVNIDFATRTVCKEFTPLTFIRIGTSGAIQKDIPIDSFLVTTTAIGFDSLLHFYKDTYITNSVISQQLVAHTHWSPDKATPYVVYGDYALIAQFSKAGFITGTTVTNVGFYGPQSRSLRVPVQDETLPALLQSFTYIDDAMSEKKITNLEMETSGIYGMAKLLGHKAVSLNAILANRANGTFSKNPKETVNLLIEKTLSLLV